jgi:hypothetical protein
MTGPEWGFLGPDSIASERRTRTLGIGRSVREFNELAVPGLGGVWFGKQLFLATLGVVIAEKARRKMESLRNIETANALEALGCWLALKSNDWKPDSRLRGALKMRGKTDLSFSVVRKPSFYVTQPMRMSTNEPLRSLGLVESESERFNAYHPTQSGHDFVKTVFSGYDNTKAESQLLDWVLNQDALSKRNTLTATLSPIETLPMDGRAFLKDRLMMGGKGDEQLRRRKALAWVEDVRKNPKQHWTWEKKPMSLDDAHWKDLHAGSLFFGVRDRAVELLNRVESHLANLSDLRAILDESINAKFSSSIKALADQARLFLTIAYDPTPGREAGQFCKECINEESVLESLINRDGRILQMRGKQIVPGPAFSGKYGTGTQANEEANEPESSENSTEIIGLPLDISYRIRNLFCLNLDLQGSLSEWLGKNK